MSKIKVIKSEEEYEEALNRLEEIFGAESGTDEGDEVDLLLLVVDDYETKNHPIAPPTAVEAIKFMMEQLNYRQADLSRLIGRQRSSEILSGRRRISMKQAQILNSEWGVPAEALLHG